MKSLWATVSLLLEPHRPWANISLCHTHHSNMDITPHAHSTVTHAHTQVLHMHPCSSLTIFSSLSVPVLFFLFTLSEICLPPFTKKISKLHFYVSSSSSLTDYLLCFLLILIRGFHSEHQKTSWRGCILGRAPQGKCKQAAVKLQHCHTCSLYCKCESLQQLFCILMNTPRQ